MNTREYITAILLVALALGITSPIYAAVYSHYAFDSDYEDRSGNEHHGTLTDVGTVGNSGITTNVADFKFGAGGLTLSSDRDFIALPSKTFGSDVPYSIAFWARKSPGDTGDSAEWDMLIGDKSDSFFIGLNNGTGLRWRSNSDATERIFLEAAHPPRGSVWLNMQTAEHAYTTNGMAEEIPQQQAMARNMWFSSRP